MSDWGLKWRKGLRAVSLVRNARAQVARARSEQGRVGPAILVTNLAQMGDVVLCVGVAAALRERHPESPLLFAAQPAWLPILEGDPALDGLLPAQTLYEVRALARAGLFQTIYVLDIPIPTLLGYLDGLPNIFRYAPPTTGDWYTHGDKLMAFYERNAGLPEGTARPRVWVRPQDEARADALWHEYALDRADAPGPVVALHTQSSMASKNWPLDHWAALLARWHAVHGARFVVLGAAGEAEPLRALPGVTHLAGQLSVKESAAVIRRCDLFAGLDSGLAYVAEAVGTPGLVVLGATVAETSGPRGDGFAFVRAPDACRPACHRACTQSPLCITHLSVDAVDQALHQVWERSRDRNGKETVCTSP